MIDPAHKPVQATTSKASSETGQQHTAFQNMHGWYLSPFPVLTLP